MSPVLAGRGFERRGHAWTSACRPSTDLKASTSVPSVTQGTDAGKKIVGRK
ncbi:hypothetical protein ACWEN3_11850 [Streptomyces sp. NPDC004561]